MPIFELKNYRGFSDTDPLVIDFGSQFTALVGPNNAGKSSVLLAIYELRNLWTSLLGDRWANAINSNQTVAGNYLGIQDPTEIFNNLNERAVTLEIRVPKDESPDSNTLSMDRLQLRCERNNPFTWHVATYSGNRPLNGQFPANYAWDPNNLILTSRNLNPTVHVHCSRIVTAITSFARRCGQI
jgi:hypothetical protein